MDTCKILAILAVFGLVSSACGNKPNPRTEQGSMQHASMEGVNMEDTADIIYWNSLPANHTVISVQQTVTPVQSNMNFSFDGNGYVAFDQRRNHKVPVRAGGRIERLFVKYNYQYIHKGEKILELYSPELNTYVEEYLYVKNQTKDSVLQSKAKQKLLLLGFTVGQIKQIDHEKQASFTIPIYSPYEGYVLFNPSVSSAPGMENARAGGMGMGTNPASQSDVGGTLLPDNSIREGMYVSKDQTLFWINDFREAWGIIAFTTENEKYIKKGLPITVRSELFPERPIQTFIQLIEPVYQQDQRFTQVRVYLSNNQGVLKQNSLITATVSIPVKSLMVPISSVYYLGKMAIVWVRVGTTKEGNNIFQSRVVKVGHRTKNETEILEGLQQNEAIAKDAGYLADSETIIKY